MGGRAYCWRMRQALVVSVLLFGGCAGRNTRDEAPAASAERWVAALEGRWQGVLEYRDYQPPHRQVELPTTLVAATRPDGSVAMNFEFDDGPSKKVRSRDIVRLDLPRGQFAWGEADQDPAMWSVYRVLEFASGDATTRLAAERVGEDDGQPAVLRQTFIVTTTSMTIVKLVQPTGGGASYVRHEYRLSRTR